MAADIKTKNPSTNPSAKPVLRDVYATDTATQQARLRLLRPTPKKPSRREPLLIGAALVVALVALVGSYSSGRNLQLFAATEVTFENETALAVVPADTLSATEAQRPSEPEILDVETPALPPSTIAPPSVGDTFPDAFTAAATTAATTDITADFATDVTAEELASDDLAPTTVEVAEETPFVMSAAFVASLSEAIALANESPAPEPVAPVTDISSAAALVLTGDTAEFTMVDLDGETFDISGSLLFEYASSDIRPEYSPFLDDIAARLARRPELSMIVIGHTDDRGAQDRNMALSLERAQSVVDYFLERGIAEARLSAVGKGENEPVADNTTEEGRALNRRIEVLLEKSKRN